MTVKPPDFLMVLPADIGRVGFDGAAILALVRYVTGLPGENNGRRTVDGKQWWCASHDDIGQALGGVHRKSVGRTLLKLENAGDLLAIPAERFYGDRAQAYRASDQPLAESGQGSDQPLAESGPPSGRKWPSSWDESGQAAGTKVANPPSTEELNGEEQQELLLDPDGSSDNALRLIEAEPVEADPVRSASYPAAFEDWWSHYPRKTGKRKAFDAWVRARRRATDEQLIDGARRYAADPNREDQFTKYPEGWLNRDGWLDDPIPPRRQNAGRASPISTSDQRAAQVQALKVPAATRKARNLPGPLSALADEPSTAYERKTARNRSVFEGLAGGSGSATTAFGAMFGERPALPPKRLDPNEIVEAEVVDDE